MRGLSCRGSRWFVLCHVMPPSVSTRRMAASPADILRTNDLDSGSDVSRIGPLSWEDLVDDTGIEPVVSSVSTPPAHSGGSLAEWWRAGERLGRRHILRRSCGPD